MTEKGIRCQVTWIPAEQAGLPDYLVYRQNLAPQEGWHKECPPGNWLVEFILQWIKDQPKCSIASAASQQLTVGFRPAKFCLLRGQSNPSYPITNLHTFKFFNSFHRRREISQVSVLAGQVLTRILMSGGLDEGAGPNWSLNRHVYYIVIFLYLDPRCKNIISLA